MQGQIKEIFRFIVFILLAIYIVPVGFLIKKHDDKWQALWKKKDKGLVESLHFTAFLFIYIPNIIILNIIEEPWRDKISVYKL